MAPNREEEARRVKLARKHAGYTQRQLAQLVGSSESLVKRWENPAQVPDGIARHYLLAIAAVCGLPIDFFDTPGPASASELDANARDLEARIRRLEAQVRSLNAASERLLLAGELGRDAQDTERTPQHPEREPPEEEEGQTRGTDG